MSEPMPPSLVTSPPTTEPTVGNALEADAQEKKSRDKPRGLLGDAWRDLRRKPLFWISAALILLFVLMAAMPFLFTSASPSEGVLARSRVSPSADAWFGYDVQGRDVYARVIYGARASIVVSLASTFGTVLFGGMMGVIAGYRGGWLDGLVSRLGEVFSGIPFVLGAIVILFTFNGPGTNRGPWAIMAIVVVSLVILTWPVSMRIMRSSVLAVRDADYIVAARAMGAGPGRIIFKHLIPNCLAPLLVYSTILIGSFVGAEATLSFLGVGLRTPVVSWGIMINEAQNYIRVSPFLLFFPSAFLVTAVLAFVMLGEAVREALDPKLR
ncbi:ABC transporter permease [Actinoplanes sp. NPDC049316]|uniref:ABC transporter permease n=1 Tax=Actinoplanes sp. NPDC049316 TaxID=3154727 RepID=UPI003419612C